MALNLQILIPFRDASAHLPTLVADLAAQTDGAFEVVDVDDRIDPARFALQRTFFETAPPEVSVLGCGVESFVQEQTEEIGEGFARYDAWLNGLRTPEAIAREAFIESPLAHPTVVFRREAIRAHLDASGWREGEHYLAVA